MKIIIIIFNKKKNRINHFCNKYYKKKCILEEKNYLNTCVALPLTCLTSCQTHEST